MPNFFKLEIKMNDKELIINGLTYILKEDPKDLKYVIVRTYSAGVFAGYLKSKINQEVILSNARRIWYWDGASSLSQLAMEGTKLPENCKFPCEVNIVELFQVIEILDVTPEAQQSIAEVPVWKQ